MCMCHILGSGQQRTVELISDTSYQVSSQRNPITRSESQVDIYNINIKRFLKILSVCSTAQSKNIRVIF